MKNTKSFKTICAFSIVAFSLISCVVGVFAWFSGIRNRDSESSNLTILNPQSLNLSYDLYYCHTTTKKVVKQSSNDDDFDLSLQTYSTSVSQTNEPFNNILRIVVDFGGTSQSGTKDLSLSIKSTEREEGSLYDIGPEGATRTHVDTAGYKFHYKKTGEKEANFICDYISNLIQFKGFLYSYNIGDTKYLPSPERPCLVDTDKTIDYTSDETLFDSAESIFDDLEDFESFVSGASKSSSIDVDYTLIPAEASKVEFFIEYNYNDNLLNDYFNSCEYLRNREFGGTFDPTKASLNVKFVKDLVSIELNTKSENS